MTRGGPTIQFHIFTGKLLILLLPHIVSSRIVGKPHLTGLGKEFT
jgi:hypothetical protein